MSWRERHLAAIHELEDAAAAVMLGALDQILDDVQAGFAAVTAAAGDEPEEPQGPPGEPTASLDDLAQIQAQWAVALDGTVMPWFGTVFGAGGIGAAEQITEVTGRTVPPAAPDLMNEAAATHLATARNRLLSVGNDTWVKARGELLEGFRAGEDIDSMRRRLQEVTGLARAQAEAVARTEVISAANAGSMARVRLMGADAPPYKQWLSTMDRRTRPTHAEADNQVVERDGRFVVGASVLDVPGDPTAAPAETVNCRCTVLFLDEPEPMEVEGRQVGGITEETAPLVADALNGTVESVDPAGGIPISVASALEARRRELAAMGVAWSPGGWCAPAGPLYAPATVSLDGLSWQAEGEPHPAVVDSTTGEVHTGSMIALLPTQNDAESLAIPDGELVEALHLTLWFLGEAAAIPADQREALRSEVEAVAAQTPRVVVDPGAFGAAVWNPGGENPCVVYNVGGAGMAELRDVMPRPPQMPEQHTPWSAHICAAYTDDPGALLPQMVERLGPVTFDRVRLTFADEVIDIPLGQDVGDDAVVHAAATPNEEGVMPYEVRQGGDDCPYEVVQTPTGERMGCHDTEQEAEDQVAALYANEPELEDEALDLSPQPGEHFHAVMHTQGVSTGMRTFTNLSWRTPPFAFHWQRSSSAHGGMPEVVQVGLVDRVVQAGDVLHAWGHLDLGGETGREFARQLTEGFMRWVSIGLDEQPVDMEIVWPEDMEDEDEPMAALFAEPEQVLMDGGRIGELTAVSMPAQDDATVEPTPELAAALAAPENPEEAPALAASSNRTPAQPRRDEPCSDCDEPSVADVVQGITAAAYQITIPDLPPAWWFEEPTDVEIAGALNVTDDGRLYGALAPLGVNHRAFARAGRRQEVPFGNVDYGRFMGAWALTSSGKLPAGPVTMDCGHASRFRPNHDVAPDHYENACSVVAKVCVGENRQRGIVWVAGALEPGVSVDQVSRMLACRLSGDWQPHADKAGWQELVAALLVPSPGFPMAHAGPSAKVSDGVLVASSVPVRAVGAVGRPRLKVDLGAKRVTRMSASATARSRIRETVARVKGA